MHACMLLAFHINWIFRLIEGILDECTGRMYGTDYNNDNDNE